MLIDYLDRYKKRLNISDNNKPSDYLREVYRDNSINVLKELFSHDVACQDNVFFWNKNIVDTAEYNNSSPLLIKLFNRKFSNANGETAEFQTMIDTPIIVGDILYLKDMDRYYLCTESFNLDKIHYQGKLTLCNWTLKWQNEQGKILNYPCVDINSTQYNSGESYSSPLTVGSSQHLIILPCDENTVVINTPQRFYLDKNYKNPTSFIVTQNDTTSYAIGKKGLVRVTLYQYPKDENTDRPDLGICDYKEISNVENTHTYYIKYNTNIVKSGGNKQIYTIASNGDEIDYNILDWNIVADSTIRNDILTIKEKNQISIWINNDDLISEFFKLQLINKNTKEIYDELLIETEALF